MTDLGYSASEVGIIFAAAPLVRFLLPFIFMKGLQLSANMFRASFMLVSLSLLLFYFVLDSFYPLLFVNILLGVGLGLTLPYVENMALHTIGKERYGKVRLFGSLGFIVVALVLVKFLSSAYVALDFLLFLSIAMALSAFYLQKIAPQTKEEVQEENPNDLNLLREWQLWLGLLLMQTSFGSFYNFFTIYETDRGISLDMTIYLWSFGVVVEVFMLFFQGRFLRGNLLTVLQFTIFVTVLRWFLIFAYPTELAILFFAQSLHALSFALFHSATISYLHQHYKNRTLSQQLYSGVGYGLGGLIGALLAGYIYEYYPNYLFLSSSFIAFGAWIMITLYKKRLNMVKY